MPSPSPEEDHLYFAIREQKVFFLIKAFQSGNTQGGEGVPGETHRGSRTLRLHLVEPL